jgi:radical SAM-linked protein
MDIRNPSGTELPLPRPRLCLDQAGEQDSFDAQPAWPPGITERFHGREARFPKSTVNGMFRREPEVGPVGSLIEVAKEATAAIRTHNHVANAENAAASEDSIQWDRVTSGDNPSGCAHTPAATEARQLQVRSTTERRERRAGLVVPFRRERRLAVWKVGHGVPSSLRLAFSERKRKRGGTNPEAAVNPRICAAPATKSGHRAKWLVRKGIPRIHDHASHSECGNHRRLDSSVQEFFTYSTEHQFPDSSPLHPSGYYAEDVSMRASHPSIPAEALARRVRLQTVLRAMEEMGPSLEPACLRDLRDMIAGRVAPDLDGAIKSILAGDVAVEAHELCRSLRRGVVDTALMDSLVSRMVPLAAKAQQQRSTRWQLDTRRTLIRLSYRKVDNALDFDDGDLHALLQQAFRLEGLPLLLDLGKRPRPLLSIGLPLPAGVGGLAESMDAMLGQHPAESPGAILARLNHRLPKGVHIHQWVALPEFASQVSDLALLSRWRWDVPLVHRLNVEEKAASFLETSHWPWDRGPSHPEGPVDLRSLIVEMRWEDQALCFATRMGRHRALNPLKMLGAIFGSEVSCLTGLVRTSVDLKPDPRLGQAERFQPKLKNMYEDAVLLAGGSNIILVDEDDDDPIILS